MLYVGAVPRFKLSVCTSRFLVSSNDGNKGLVVCKTFVLFALSAAPATRSVAAKRTPSLLATPNRSRAISASAVKVEGRVAEAVGADFA